MTATEGAARAPRARGTTIVAVASPTGGAIRGVLRLSGPAAGRVVRETCSCAGAPFEVSARSATFVSFDDGVAPLPALVLWFPAPHSFTREDVAELHVPGAAPLVARALARCLALGAVLAEPGEFTRRAFAHGRIDLSRAEGVLALVEARTRGERRAATALLFGGLERRVQGVRDTLDEARALVEASLDFDEADTGHVPWDEVAAALARATGGLQEARAFEARREALRGGARVALVGEPNAGKSSLFNRLLAAYGAQAADEDLALVADVRGTTRDTKRGALKVAGQAFELVDTAGLELPTSSAGHASEPSPLASGPAPSPMARPQDIARGMEASALAARDSADVLVWVIDARRPEAASRAHAERSLGPAALGPGAPPVLVAWNQVDRAGAVPPPPGLALGLAPDGPGDDRLARANAVVATSAATGAGVRALAEALAAALSASGSPGAVEPTAAAGPCAGPAGGPPGGPRGGPRGGPSGGLAAGLAARAQARLTGAWAHLAAADRALADGLPLDLIAQHLRDGTDELDEITGRTTPEDLLDRIFARFCLGK
ncbi:MAG: GTPase [Planctomycetota bacterium]